MSKVLITTVPFGERNRVPYELLEAGNIEYATNPLGRRLTEKELTDLVSDFDVLIAGTEPITRKVLARATQLKLISRVGVGLDSVDLLAAQRQNIRVSYTPEAPAPAVAELTLALMLCLLRHVHVANAEMHRGQWHRYLGRRLSDVTVGIIGVGRIGRRVVDQLSRFETPRVLLNDLYVDTTFAPTIDFEWVSKEEIHRHADVISIHVPLTVHTKDMIRREELRQMKAGTILINTARGGIVNEPDLAEALGSGHLGGAAMDVFEKEPYLGPLTGVERCILTPHLGAMSVDCRVQMEIEATQEAVRFLNGRPLLSPVPQAEYDMQRETVYGRSR